MKRYLIYCTVFMSAQLMWAQHTLSGKVVDANDKPIEKAKIYLDSINSNVLSNSRGYFQVEVPEGVTYIHVFSDKHGLLTVENNDDTFLKFMYLDKKFLTGVDVEGKNQAIGYGEVPEEDTTYAVVNVETNGEDQTHGFNTIYDLMRARLAGVQVTNDNKVFIRGNASFRTISPPLFVVDGTIVSTIDWISPIDVKEISVLKDAASSIYGSRGANGVIIIETRKE